MFRPRIIPVLLLNGCQACKTVQFKKRIDIGDPINIVSIFNTFRVDELIVLDIDASNERRLINLDLLKDISSEAKMPFSAGGGVKTLKHVETLLAIGAEKVVVSTALFDDPLFVASAVNEFGSSSIVVCIDVRTDWLNRIIVSTNSGKCKHFVTPLAASKKAEDLGVGEIIIQSVARDGMMSGYDVPILADISSALRTPVVALGGAGSMNDMQVVYSITEISALASGSFFVFKGKERGVLISYPSKDQLNSFSFQRKF